MRADRRQFPRKTDSAVAAASTASVIASEVEQVEMIGNDLTHRRYINGPTIKVAEMTIGGT